MTPTQESIPPENPGRPAPRLRRRTILCRVALGLAIALILGLPLVRQALFRGPLQTTTALPDSPIIDLHCHAAGIGAGDSGCYVSPALRSNVRFRIYLQAFGVTEAELQQQGDRLLLDRLSKTLTGSRHVKAAVVLALDGAVDAQGQLDLRRTEVYVPNEFIAEGARRHSNLLFGASINPNRPDALQRLDDCARQGAVLVKWIPSIMDIDPADPRHIPFYRRMRELGIPLLSHTGLERSFTASRDELADPSRLQLPLEQGVTVIAAHAAGGRVAPGRKDFQELRELMRRFPNLLADLSALTQINKPGALETTLADPLLRERVVYGSDFPLINTALVSAWYFTLNLPLARSREIQALPNPWDRDITLKQSLGVPREVFARSASLLRSSR